MAYNTSADRTQSCPPPPRPPCPPETGNIFLDVLQRPEILLAQLGSLDRDDRKGSKWTAADDRQLVFAHWRCLLDPYYRQTDICINGKTGAQIRKRLHDLRQYSGQRRILNGKIARPNIAQYLPRRAPPELDVFRGDAIKELNDPVRLKLRAQRLDAEEAAKNAANGSATGVEPAATVHTPQAQAHPENSGAADGSTALDHGDSDSDISMHSLADASDSSDSEDEFASDLAENLGTSAAAFVARVDGVSTMDFEATGFEHNATEQDVVEIVELAGDSAASLESSAEVLVSHEELGSAMDLGARLRSWTSSAGTPSRS